MEKNLNHIEPGWEPPYEFDRVMTPYIRLWGNFLLIGLRDAHPHILSNRGDFITREEIMDLGNANARSAVRWVLSNTYRAGSFVWVCQVLGYDHEKIRKSLLDLNRKANTI